MLHNLENYTFIPSIGIIIQSNMDPQVNDTTIVLKVTEHLSNFPAHISQIIQAVKKARANDPILLLLSEQQIISKVISSNLKMIEWQFIDMMQIVLRKIQPQIRHYPQHKSIKYLQYIIYQQLDPTIFTTDVRISKIRTKLLGDSFEKSEMTIIDKFLTELITVMNQLLQIMKQNYGLPRDDKVSGVLFQCIHMFVLENQNCFLVQQDSKLKTPNNQKGNVLIDTLDEIKKNNMSKMPSKAQDALKIGQFLVGTFFQHIKNRIPFGDKKTTQKQIQQKKNKIKQIQNIQKRQILDENSIKIIQQLMSLDRIDLIKTMSKSEKAQFTSIIFDTLQHSSTHYKNNRLSKIQQIQSQITQILQSTIEHSQMETQGEFGSHKQIKWIVLLYKALQKQYSDDPERRKWLYKFLQNQHILNKVKNPFFVIKVIEIDKLQESNIVKSLRSLPLSTANENKKIQKQIVQAHLAIEHQLNRIHLFELRKKYAKQPTLEIEKLSTSKRRVITFLFSGFLSEDTDKAKQWEGLLNNFYDSEVYSVRWQSKSVKNMMQFAVKSIVDLGPTQSIAMLGGPYIKAIAILHNLYQKFQENPFNPAFDAAKSTGQFFAEFLIHNFKGYFINLVGFSLGTQLIQNIMRRLTQKKSLHILNKVYLMGGVADKSSVQKLIEQSPSPLTIINMYSDNDYILKYLLRICKSGIVPVGLNPLKQMEGHIIKNQDCTHYIQGHLSYRPNMQIFAKLLKIADD